MMPVLCSIGAKSDVQGKQGKGFKLIQYIERHFLGCFVYRIQALHSLPF